MASGLIVIGGGVRSGKSRYALDLALAQPGRRVFIATAQAFDDEMRQRIDDHRAERGDAFETIEAPIELADALAQASDASVVLLDCLTLWLSNMILAGREDSAVLGELERILSVERDHGLIVVTNEVGMGIVPDTPLGRRFRDLAGRANQALARRADALYAAMLGTILRLRPGPVTAVSSPEKE